MTDQNRLQRLAEMKVDFRRLLDFHEKSFAEIDAKAKYWLTLTLPLFIALAGYILKQWASLPLVFLLAGSALAAVLVISTFLFSTVLVGCYVDSGVLAPENRDPSGMEYFLENEVRWVELYEDQVAEMLRSIANNEKQNARKAIRMRRGEVSLFRGAPAAICLAAGAAFVYAASGPGGLASAAGAISAGTAAGITCCAGISIGTLAATGFVAADHYFTKKVV